LGRRRGRCWRSPAPTDSHRSSTTFSTGLIRHKQMPGAVDVLG
jgi:hypothetical protein